MNTSLPSKPTEKHRYAEGTFDGVKFRIQVAPKETLAQLKKHFRSTIGHDRIKVKRWFWQ